MEGGEAVTLASIGANLVRFQAAAHGLIDPKGSMNSIERYEDAGINRHATNIR